MKKLKYKIKILVFTTNRSDYGLLKNLIIKLKKNKKIDLKLLVSGSHLIKNYGNTIKEIEKDKIKIFKKINVNYKNDSNYSICNYNLDISKKFNKILLKNSFDFIIALGDRSEILFCSTIALIYNIKLIHLHGGEVTKGSIDNKSRNVISQLSYFHFVSHDSYKKNLIRLGIYKNKILVVGGLGASSINNIKIESKNFLEKKLKLKLNQKYLVVTYHPVTLKKYAFKKEFINLMSCLDCFKNVIKIITAPNIDNENISIINTIKFFVKNKKNFYYFESLGSKNYYSLLSHSAGVVGNSSSGILEAPSFKIPTLNVGSRQIGRVQAKSIVNVSFEKRQILRGLNKILFSKKFKKNLNYVSNPYYKKNTEIKIINKLLKI
jgi:GDP/UDP-N,N'-diacetylbacillosamine 2-epimerase (hydrolysing)